MFLQVSRKPKLLSHAEASSIPYVANTALSALVNAGGLCRDSAADKRQVPVSLAYCVFRGKRFIPYIL